MLSERLRFAMQRAGISQAALARACGVKAPSVHSWLNGKSKYLRGPNLLSAAKALNVSQTWLATGKGAVMPSATETASNDLDFLSWEDCLNKLERTLAGLGDQERSDIGHLLDLYARKRTPTLRQILLDALNQRP